MAATYDPPFHSSRQDQRNYRTGDPQFSNATIGDLDSSTPGTRFVYFRVYDGLTEHKWGISAPLFDRIVISKELPALVNMITIQNNLVTCAVPILLQDATNCTASRTGSSITYGGIWADQNIWCGGEMRATAFTLTSGTTLLTEKVGTVTTGDATPTTIVSYTTASNYAYTITVMVAYSLVGGSTGSFTFEYKCKNVAGVVTNSTSQMVSSAIDAALAGTNCATAISGVDTTIAGVGLAATSIKWNAHMRILAAPF
jgi:hypothetical protein